MSRHISFSIVAFFLISPLSPFKLPPVFSENVWMKLPFKSQLSRAYLFQKVSFYELFF